MLKHQSLSATHLWNPTFCIRLLASRFCHRDIKQPKPPHCTAEASKCVQVEGLGNPKKVEFHAGERIFADHCLYWRYIPISVCTGKVEIYSPIFACTGNIFQSLQASCTASHARRTRCWRWSSASSMFSPTPGDFSRSQQIYVPGNTEEKNSFRVLEFLTPLLYLEYYGFKVHTGSFEQV